MKVIVNTFLGLLILLIFFFVGGRIWLGVVHISTVARGWVAAGEGFFVLLLATFFLFMCYMMGEAVILSAGMCGSEVKDPKETKS